MSSLEFIKLDQPTGSGGPVLINIAHIKAIEPDHDSTDDRSEIYLGGLNFVVTMPFNDLLALIETIGKPR